MAGGGAIATKAANADQYNFKMNFNIVLTAIVGASAGMLFGYDIGVTGGVTSMDAFLEKFFPGVLEFHQTHVSTDPYCQYDDIMLQLFTSSLFFAGMIAAMVGTVLNKKVGRKWTMVIAGFWFMAGALLTAFAPVFFVLLAGRLCLGVGVGLANQSAPVFLNEVAPAHLRGALNIMFQLAVTVGILFAQVINLWTASFDGYRLSLGLAGVPAIVLSGLGMFLPDTPNSLAERGKLDAARQVLVKIRGVSDVDAEYEDIVAAVDEARQYNGSSFAIFKRRFRPQLVFVILIPFFQQLTGINSIMFYAPVIFKSLGFGDDAALVQTVLIGVINLVATFVSILVVDRLGRRILFLEGGTQMALALFASGLCLAFGFREGTATVAEDGTLGLPKSLGMSYLVCMCLFTAGFAWSWGPLGWLVPTEIQKMETRAMGASINVFMNFLFTFIVGQLFLTMMCAMKWGVMWFFGAWVVIMTVWVQFFCPESKGVPIEHIDDMFKRHWFWGRFIGDYNVVDMELPPAHEGKSFLHSRKDEQDDDDVRPGKYHV